MNQPAAAMPRKDRLRRVAKLCLSFARNLAYYRVAQRPDYASILDQPKVGSFWTVANGNFIDVCVLEWCKLLGDPKGKHNWYNIVSDPNSFQSQLLGHLGITEAEFDEEIEKMRRYRDKFLAHLDSDYVMDIPTLDIAKKSVWFYYAHVVNHEAQPGDLAGLVYDLDTGYAECEAEAAGVYRQALAGSG